MLNSELTVKGESIERIYSNYIDSKYKVNRRYQRKLVWSTDEKIAFIDSIINNYPVPIILLAESIEDKSIEIIDGMQRLNAIFSFIEGDFSVDGKYFSLETMSRSKALLDLGQLEQKLPVFERALCVSLTGYELPVSIFEFNTENDVDEVFRRINSGGRKLSKQELRSAGSVADFATAVRRIAAKVRGDDSHSDILLLNNMKLISVANKDLGYGINVDEVFWVAQGILTKEDVRQSHDEQLIADMLAYAILTDKPSSRSEYLDDYFGLSSGDASTKRYDEVNYAVRNIGVDKVVDDFVAVVDIVRRVSDKTSQALTSVLFKGAAQPKAPRVFQVVFLALYNNLINMNKEVRGVDGLIKKLEKYGATINVQEGSRWGADRRVEQVNLFSNKIKSEFMDRTGDDPAEQYWVSRLENLLSQSKTEQSNYDFKQGLLLLDAKNKFDISSLEKILKTCVGISNLKKSSKGYVIVGVSDKKSTTNKINEVYGVASVEFNGFFINGIDHEAAKLGKNLDQYFQFIVSKIKESKLSTCLMGQILRDIKFVTYKEKSLLILEVNAQDDPSSYEDIYYIREGANLRPYETKEIPQLFKRFYASTIY